MTGRGRGPQVQKGHVAQVHVRHAAKLSPAAQQPSPTSAIPKLSNRCIRTHLLSHPSCSRATHSRPARSGEGHAARLCAPLPGSTQLTTVASEHPPPPDVLHAHSSSGAARDGISSASGLPAVTSGTASLPAAPLPIRHAIGHPVLEEAECCVPEEERSGAEPRSWPIPRPYRSPLEQLAPALGSTAGPPTTSQCCVAEFAGKHPGALAPVPYARQAPTLLRDPLHARSQVGACQALPVALSEQFAQLLQRQDHRSALVSGAHTHHRPLAHPSINTSHSGMPEQGPALVPQTLPMAQHTQAANSTQLPANKRGQPIAGSAVNRKSVERWGTSMAVLDEAAQPLIPCGVGPLQFCHAGRLSSIEGQSEGRPCPARARVEPSPEGLRGIGATTMEEPRNMGQGPLQNPRGEDASMSIAGEEPAGMCIPPKSGNITGKQAVNSEEESAVLSPRVAILESEAVLPRASVLSGFDVSVSDLDSRHAVRQGRIQELAHAQTHLLPPRSTPEEQRDWVPAAASVIVGRHALTDDVQGIKPPHPDAERWIHAVVQPPSVTHSGSCGINSKLSKSCAGQDQQGGPRGANIYPPDPVLPGLGHGITASWSRSGDVQSCQVEERLPPQAPGGAGPASTVPDVQKIIQEIGERQEEARRVLELCLAKAPWLPQE